MEITADNINVSSDESQTFFLCVLNAGKRDNEVTTPFCRTSQKREKKNVLDSLILDSVSIHWFSICYTNAIQSLSNR